MRAYMTILLVTLGTVAAGCASAPARNPGASLDDDAPPSVSSHGGDRSVGAAARDSLGSEPGGSRRGPVRGDQEIAPGFEIAISNLEDRALNGRYRVDFEGKVRLPYNVTLRAAGSSLAELKEAVNTAYQKYFRGSPNISVTILDRKYWVEVRGLVEKPGRFLVRRDTSIDEIIGAAGGMLKTATPKYVKIDQPGSSVTVKLADYYGGADQGKIPPWYGGDIISLLGELVAPEAEASGEDSYLQILGEVRNPGEYRYRRNADLYYYLAKAGGPTNTADLDTIEVVRGPAGERRSTTFELTPKKVPPLAAGDLVIVHADKQTKTERTIAAVSGVTGILDTILLSIILLVK